MTLMCFVCHLKNRGKRFWSFPAGRSAAARVSAALFGIIFIANPDFVFASDYAQVPPARSGALAQVGRVAHETARLPVSSLNLILTGTITGTTGRALIRVKGGKDKLFAVGQEIISGVFLTDVFQRGVVISHDGVLEKLAMSSRAESQDVARIESDPPAGYSQPLSEETGRDQENNPYFIKRNFANKLFEAPDLLTHAKLVPVQNGGIQISDIAPGSVYERLGLNNGDAIRSINGAPVNSISEFENLFQHRNSTDRLQVGVVSSGNSYKIQFDPEHGIEIVSELVKQ
jgi:type II secretory pathway component PulC